MMKRFLIILFIAADFFQTVNAGNIKQQDELVIHGNYTGNNIVILNPMKNNEFSVKDVFINNLRFDDEIRSRAFEIDLEKHNLSEGDTIVLKIIYSPEAGIPSIYNPEVIKKKNYFRFVNATCDKKTQQIIWSVESNALTESFEVEHYRWDKWMTIKLVQPDEMKTESTFSTSFDPHSGRNLFRVKYIDSEGNVFYSGDIKYTSKIKEVILSSDKVKDSIELSDKTMYQLFNQNGVLIMDGWGNSINIDFLEKGKYFLNFDNKTVVITKR
jgi:hypothetical protein